MYPVLVKQLRVLIYLPEDDLVILTACDYSISRIKIYRVNIALVSIMGVHVCHLSQVPNLERAVVRDRIELIIFFVETHSLNFDLVTRKTYCD